jgi:hypothetical protein
MNVFEFGSVDAIPRNFSRLVYASYKALYKKLWEL